MRKLDDYVTKNLDRISTYIFGSHIALYGRTLPSHIAHHVFTINEFLALRGLDEIIPANAITKFKNQVKNAYLSNKLVCPNEEHKFVKADNNYRLETLIARTTQNMETIQHFLSARNHKLVYYGLLGNPMVSDDTVIEYTGKLWDATSIFTYREHLINDKMITHIIEQGDIPTIETVSTFKNLTKEHIVKLMLVDDRDMAMRFFKKYGKTLSQSSLEYLLNHTERPISDIIRNSRSSKLTVLGKTYKALFKKRA